MAKDQRTRGTCPDTGHGAQQLTADDGDGSLEFRAITLANDLNSDTCTVWQGAHVLVVSYRKREDSPTGSEQGMTKSSAV